MAYLLRARTALTSNVSLVLSQVDVLPDVVDQRCSGVRTKEGQEKLKSRQRGLQSVGWEVDGRSCEGSIQTSAGSPQPN